MKQNQSAPQNASKTTLTPLAQLNLLISQSYTPQTDSNQSLNPIRKGSNTLTPSSMSSSYSPLVSPLPTSGISSTDSSTANSPANATGPQILRNQTRRFSLSPQLTSAKSTCASPLSLSPAIQQRTTPTKNAVHFDFKSGKTTYTVNSTAAAQTTAIKSPHTSKSKTSFRIFDELSKASNTSSTATILSNIETVSSSSPVPPPSRTSSPI